jgi:NADH-quinone oxidoreductase subunit L
MWRCWWLAFGGKPRNEELAEHAHEAPIMTMGLLILGVLAVVAGYFHAQDVIATSLPGAAAMGGEVNLAMSMHTVEEAVQRMCDYSGPLVFAPPISFLGEFRLPFAFIFGPVLAIAIYFRGFAIADRIRRLPLINLVYIWLREKMYFDAFYDGVVVNLTKTLSATLGLLDKFGVDGIVNLVGFLGRMLARLSGLFDTYVIDGLVNGAASLAQLGGRGVLTPQAGRIRIYVLGMFTALALVVAGVLFFAMMSR